MNGINSVLNLKSCQAELVEAGIIHPVTRLRQTQADSTLIKAGIYFCNVDISSKA
jgi:hypothetical protein